MTTESLQAPPRDDSDQALQYFSFAESLWAAILVVSLYLVNDLPGQAKSLAKTAQARTALAASAAGTAAGTALAAAGLIAHAVAAVTADHARAVKSVAAEKARPVLEPLGFGHGRDSKTAAWRVVRYPQFRHYLLGSVISNWGTWLQNTAQMLLAYNFTHSVLTVGLVTCAQFSTPLIFAPWASVVADRVGARRTLVVTQVASAIITATMAILGFTHSLSETYLFIGAFAIGLMFTFALPAQSALIPALVPDDPADSKAAMVMNSVAYNAGRMVAPAFTVLIVMIAGFWWVFALNTVTFAVFVGVLRNVRPLAAVPMTKTSRVRDGLRVAREDRRILVLLLVVAAVTLAEDPVLVLGPGLARHSFHIPYDCSGYFLCALGAGSVVSSLLPRRGSPSTRRAAAALGLLGVSIVTFVLAPWMWLSVAAAFSAGLWGLIAGSAAQAMLRHHAGKDRALQVMGLWAVAWAGSKPFASLLDGLLPSLTSVQITGVIMAIPALLPALLLILRPEATRRVIKYQPPHTPQESHESQESQESQEPQWVQPFTEAAGGDIAA